MSNFRRIDDKLVNEDFKHTLYKCVESANTTVNNNISEEVYPTCEEYLRELIDKKSDQPIAESKHLVKFDQLLNRRLIRFLMDWYPKCSIVPSGNFLYPPGGYMSWHTNSDFPSKRLYITMVDQIGKSGFKYYFNNQVIDDVDNATITIREFDVCSKDLFWHCVYSNTNRYSFGYRIEPF